MPPSTFPKRTPLLPPMATAILTPSLERRVAKKSAADRLAARLETLEKNIRSYNSRFDFLELVRALQWAEENQRQLTKAKARTVDDIFSDPLLIVEQLVKLAEADRETILASIIYPSVRSADGEIFDAETLKPIALLFGPNVARLVDHTLRFRAMKKRELKAGSTQTVSDNRKMFRLMGLWVAKDKRAILIRGTQLAVNLEREAQKPGTFSAETKERMMDLAENLHAPLAYLSNYALLRKKLRNLVYQVDNKAEYVETRQIISQLRTEDERLEVEDIISANLSKRLGWQRGVHFEVEFREKSPAEARTKAVRKKLKVSELGDLNGVRVILLLPAIGLAQDTDLTRLAKPEANALKREFGKKCIHVYGVLSQTFGRGNRRNTETRTDEAGRTQAFSEIQERFAQLAKTHPRDLSDTRLDEPARAGKERKKYPKIKDSMFDDYITWPKMSGYSAIQDLMIVKLKNGKSVELETQIVDQFRHHNNSYGSKIGHYFYKTDLNDYARIILDWMKAAVNHMQGRTPAGRQHTIVVDGYNQLLDISMDPTLGGFLAATRETFEQVHIRNNHDVDVRTGDRDYHLTSGCIITPVL